MENSDLENIESHKLENDLKRMQDEFNMQRAKMKELYLQKEAELLKKNEENIKLKDKNENLRRELDDIKSQLVVEGMTRDSTFEVEKRKADEEIASLQQLIHETVEESSTTRSLYDTELQKLQSYIQFLQQENTNLKAHQVQVASQEHSLAPSNVLNALTKGIVKKLGADTFSSQDDSKEDEDIRSLVEPLEDQIKALKEKLRSTDEKLQKCKECRHNRDSEKDPPQPINMQQTTATNTSFDAQKRLEPCDMCANYEAQLVNEQQKNADLEAKVQKADKSAERHKEDLLKEIGFRKEMEEKWNEKKEEHKKQVAELTRTTECTEQDLKELRQFFNQMCHELKNKLETLTHERETIYKELDKLQKENDHLIGKYTITSQELQSEAINLPNTVEELHELVLKNHQELIIAKIGKEAAESKCNTIQSEFLLLKDQITNDRQEWKGLEDNLMKELNALTRQKTTLEKERKTYLTNQEKMLGNENLLQEKVTEIEGANNEKRSQIKTLEAQNLELKNRVYSLQQELDNTEAVQKDFVRLSQSLQVQLEKIRESDSEVRWQHDEDIDECASCKNGFSGPKKKSHCRHCGQIFCQNCLTKMVPSGPHMRPSKVCDVCHTLLVKSSAPYFSEAPPMT